MHQISLKVEPPRSILRVWRCLIPHAQKSISSRVILEGHGILNDLNTLVPLKKNEFNSQRRVKRAALFAVSRVRCTDRSHHRIIRAIRRWICRGRHKLKWRRENSVTGGWEKGGEKGSRRTERKRENSGPSRSYTGTATARDDNMLRSTKSSQNEEERGRKFNPLWRQCDISLLTLPLRRRVLDPKARFKLNTQIFAYFIPGVLSAGRVLLPARAARRV